VHLRFTHPGLAGDLARELALALRPPYLTPLVVYGNAVLVTVAWFLLPTAVQDWLFRLHGPFAFPIALASWMLADVPATNVLATDPKRAIAAIGDPRDLLGLLYAKSLALWLFVAPLAAVAALVVGERTGRWTTCVLTVLWVIVIPAGTLGFSSWLGIVWPYHPRPLRWRWEHRQARYRVIIRWMALVLAPYVLVPAIGMAIVAPAAVAWLIADGPSGAKQIPDDQFALLGGITAAVAVVTFVVGHRLAVRLARRRRDPLTAYLADPERG
jgi:hypothetical protein